MTDADRAAPATSRGRRPGGPDTRAAVLHAARHCFAEDGYDGTSIRRIAAAAGVDAALVMHQYGSKAQLFGAVIALPEDAADSVTAALDGPAARIGEQLTRAFLLLWTAPATASPLIATFRSAVTNEEAADRFRAFLRGRLLEVFVPRFPDLPDAERRASVAAALLLGAVVARHVLRVESIAAAETEELVALIGPALQRILVP